MQARRTFLNWGIFLVCLGAVPLAVQLGVLDRDTAASLVRLWPLILVGIGLGLLLRFSRLAALGGTVVAGTLGLLVGVLFAGGFPSAATACTGGDASGPSTVRNGTFGAAAHLSLELTCAEMTVERAPGGAWSVDVRADHTPLIEASDASLRLRSEQEPGFLFGVDQREVWRVVLPTETDLSVSLTTNAAQLRANLGQGEPSDINATFNASDALVDLSGSASAPAAFNATLNASSVSLMLPSGAINGNMTLNASSLELCTTPEIGLRITYDDMLSSHNFAAAGLTQSGKTWQSANYGSAAVRTDLRISANVSSTTLNPTGGCQ